MDMDDMFQQFFGGGGGRGGHGGGFHFQHGGPGGHGGGQFGHHQEHEPQPTPFLFQSTDVFQLNLGSITQFYRRKDIWIILFHDGASQEAAEFKEQFTELAEKMYGIMSVGAIDCREDEELCEEFSVYSGGKGNQIKIFTENAHDDGTLYTGKMEWRHISGEAAKKMQSFVSVVTSENYEAFAA